MKKTLSFITLAATALSLSAAGMPDNIRYALPRTAISLKVDYRELCITAGPCAEYAWDLLGMDVPSRDTTIFSIDRICLDTCTEPDYGHVVTCNAKEEAKLQELCRQGLISLGPLPAEARNSYVEMPVRKYTVRPDKGLIEAKTAAEAIESYRTDIYNITIGNTDAAYQGEALDAALRELHSREAELLSLFTAVEEEYVHSISLDLTPEYTDDSTMRIEAFRFSPQHGILSVSSGEGELYTLEILAEPYDAVEPAAPKEKQTALEYRLPVMCTVRLVCEGKVVCHLKTPVYQLGIKDNLILNK